MSMTVSQFRDELADREAIRDCLYRYARGMDRCDEEMLRSAYWEDALDDHLAGTTRLTLLGRVATSGYARAS